MIISRILFFALWFFSAISVYATTWVLPQNGDIVGEIQYTTPLIGETLSDVGIRYNIGYDQMVAANPHVPLTRPLSLHTKLVIPSRYILPAGGRQGLVINLAEYRLYFYPPGDNVVITMPVGIGREGWTTPVGLTHITQKERDPLWHPTVNVRLEAAKHGMPIPNEFPPGSNNPLGRHVLRLGWPTYLIHGTNRRDGVGMRVSAGCIRMMPEDIEQLFDLVSVGLPVRIVNEPVKVGHLNGDLFLEVHAPLVEQKKQGLQAIIHTKLAQFLTSNKVNMSLVNQELERPSGMVQKIVN